VIVEVAGTNTRGKIPKRAVTKPEYSKGINASSE